MKNINFLVIVCIVSLSISCAQTNPLKDVDFLVGTWKMEGRENYESWEKAGEKLKGESYKIKDGSKKVSESLEITFQNNQIIYTATVFNQNQGKGIPFTLNTNDKEFVSFENPEHDFPNKIQYKPLSEKEVLVKVLGKDGKGFSYKLIKKE